MDAIAKKLASKQFSVRSEEESLRDWEENEKNASRFESTYGTVNKTAHIRLLKDLKEILRNPLKTVSAVPCEDDLFVWHCNLRPNSGPYAGVTLHLQLTFPKNYPFDPPQLELFTPIPHPNVFGSWVCLNMLRPRSIYENYSGWTSAYSVQSILLQLQSFLTAENVPQDYGGDSQAVVAVDRVDRAKEKIDEFECDICGHHYMQPYPPLPPFDSVTDVPENCFSSIFQWSNKPNPYDCSKQIFIGENVCVCDEEKGWYGVRAQTGFIFGTNLKRSIYFEMVVAGTGVSRIGWSLKRGKYNLGTDNLGWGYGGTAKKSHNNVFTDYGEGYRKGDVISTSIDLVTGHIAYYKNGRCMGIAFTVPKELVGEKIYPTVAVRRMEFKLNFSDFLFTPKQFMKTGFVGQKLYGQVENKVEESVNYFERLPDPVLADLLDYLDDNTLLRIQFQNKQFKRVVTNFFLLQKRELVCFHTKLNYKEAVLGIPITVGKDKRLFSSGEIVSRRAWEENVRMGIWGTPFHYWFPLVINTNNAIKFGVVNGLKSYIQAANRTSWIPELVLTTFPQIMNNVISQFIEKSSNAQVVPSMCESVLQTYVSFHHMFLTLNEPSLAVKVDVILDNIVKSPEKVKLDLLNVLQATCISNRSFEDVKEQFVEQFLARNAAHSCRSIWNSGNSVEANIEASFKALCLPIQKLLVQLYFVKNYARFETPEKMLQHYNVTFGRVNDAMALRLKNAANKILLESTDDTAGALFKYAGLNRPTNEKLKEIFTEGFRK